MTTAPSKPTRQINAATILMNKAKYYPTPVFILTCFAACGLFGGGYRHSNKLSLQVSLPISQAYDETAKINPKQSLWPGAVRVWWPQLRLLV